MPDHLLQERTLGARLRRLVAPAIGTDLPDPSPLPPGQPEPPPLRGIGTRRRREAAVDRHPAATGAAPAGGDGPPRVRIDPRIRQRRIDVKRQEGRRRLRAVVAVTCVGALLLAGMVALWSPLLRVRHVRVVGATHTPAALIVAAAGLTGHRLMVDVHSAGAAAAVDRLPWVAVARVRRSWPGAVLVQVQERSPVAQVGPAPAVLVDATGRILAPAPLGTVLPAVTIAAVGAGTPAVGPPGALVPAIYRSGLAVAATLPAALVPKVVAVVVAGDGTVALRLSGGASAVLGDTTQLADKLEAVLTMVERVQIGTGSINVTVPSAPVLTTGGGVATFSTQTGG